MVSDEPQPRWWANPAWLLVLALPLLAANVLGTPTEAVLGHPLGEQYNGLWIQWLFDRALAQWRLPLTHEGVLATTGLTFYPLDPSTLLLRWLLSSVIGQEAAYNVAAVALVGLAGGATWLLAREVGAGRWGATLAGLVAMLHPALLGYLVDGRVESCGTGWTALAAWAALRMVRRPGWRRALGLGAAVGAVAYAGPNHLVATAAVLSIPMGVALVRGARPLWRNTLLAAGVGALLCAPVVAGLYLTEVKQKRRSDWKPGGAPAVVEVVSAAQGQKMLLLWNLAGELGATRSIHVWRQKTLQQERGNAHALEAGGTLPPSSLAAPGARRFIWLSALALALVGLVRRQRKTWPWLAGGAALFLLAHGNGTGNMPPMALPFSDQYLVLRPAVLLRWFPFFLNYGIFAALAGVALGVAAGLGVAALPWRPAVCGALALAICAGEVQLAGPTPLPLPATRIPAPARVVAALRAEPRDVTVAAFPCDTRQLWLQTWHGRKVLFSWNDMSSWLGSGLHHMQRNVDQGWIDHHLVEQLHVRKVDVVVVMPGLMTEHSARKLMSTLAGSAKRVVKDVGVVAYFL